MMRPRARSPMRASSPGGSSGRTHDIFGTRRHLAQELILRGNELADAAVPDLQRVDHVRFGNLERAAFDHYDRVLAPGDDQIDVGILELLERRVEDPFVLHSADPHAGNRAGEGDLRALIATDVASSASTSASFC